MIKMSTGEDATLGNYRKMAMLFFGEDSPSVKFLDEKIEKAPNKENEEVIMDEGQMIMLLGQIHVKDQTE